MNFSNNEYLKHLDDNELIILYKNEQDKRIVGELYKRYSHLVLGMCIHYFKDKDQAKDIVVRIFEKLFTELEIREIVNFKCWLTFVVRNYCISELRKQQTRLNQEEQYKYEIKHQQIETDRDIHEQEEKKLLALEKALNDLNPFQKKYIELFYFKNMSYTQIVELTGYSINEVKSYIQNGKRNLRLLITEYK